MKKANIRQEIGNDPDVRKGRHDGSITVIQAGPCPVVQVKTAEHDGYEAVQVALPLFVKSCLQSRS